MFKNVGKEIKNNLSGVVFLTTAVYVIIPIILLFLMCNINLLDSYSAIMAGLVVVPISFAIGCSNASRKVMYLYAFGELVETVSKINEHLASQSVNQWECPDCNAVNQNTNNFCYCCGCKKP